MQQIELPSKPIPLHKPNENRKEITYSFPTKTKLRVLKQDMQIGQIKISN
ncbi:hypothetical protein KC19_2G187300 [Ceratodon purpureus]|uniref:Uncharacterized protein n=1 Tax=Ceratodon purpureus TaxID=3225 RepID=A0A8T0IY84_CERPU|nr:hypothetical protein KC19_2G187300 [Ceratodon purpureus]